MWQSLLLSSLSLPVSRLFGGGAREQVWIPTEGESKECRFLFTCCAVLILAKTSWAWHAGAGRGPPYFHLSLPPKFCRRPASLTKKAARLCDSHLLSFICYAPVLCGFLAWSEHEWKAEQICCLGKCFPPHSLSSCGGGGGGGIEQGVWAVFLKCSFVNCWLPGVSKDCF